MSDGRASSESVRAIAGSAWAFRWKVEREAAARFDSLAARLERLGEPGPIVALARGAAGDERRHAVHCARMAADLRAPIALVEPSPPPAVAPRSLAEPDAVTYELVAACCVAESISVAVLTDLLSEARDETLRAVLRELAADEVAHARLGWAHLAIAAAQGRTGFLGPLLPAMLRGSADEDLFDDVDPDREDETLLGLGVLPQSRKRELFVQVLEDVVFPGLDGARVDTSDAREWLARRRGEHRDAAGGR